MSRRSFIAIAVAALAGLVAAPVQASNDPYASRQWGLARVGAESAWATSTGTGAMIAIVDSGVDLLHPDLAAKIIFYADADMIDPTGPCPSMRKTRACQPDGAQDVNGHGTHVAGIAAAVTNNGVGIAGVAPGASILPVRVLDENGAGTLDSIAKGVRYAADRGADVINLSLNLTSGLDQVSKHLGQLSPLHEAISYAWGKGAVIVVAAGNDSFPLCAEPAAARPALCVGATDPNDLRSYYSNSDAVMKTDYLVAPGGSGTGCAADVFSTYLVTAASTCSTEAGYEGSSGSSMSAPHVSGVAALLAAQGLANQDIVDCLLDTADDLGPAGRDPIFGYGLVNAAAAVTSC